MRGNAVSEKVHNPTPCHERLCRKYLYNGVGDSGPIHLPIKGTRPEKRGGLVISGPHPKDIRKGCKGFLLTLQTLGLPDVRL